MQSNTSVSFHPDGSIASVSAPSIGDVLDLLRELRNPEMRYADIPDETIYCHDFGSVRIHRALKKLGITTIRQLAKTTPHELLSVKNFGEDSLNKVQAFLKNKNLRLGMKNDATLTTDSADPASA